MYSNSSSVYIGNLQWWTNDAEIEAQCARFGAVEKLRFFEEKPTGKSKGYVLVGFDSAKAAYECKQGLDGCACMPGLLQIIHTTGCNFVLLLPNDTDCKDVDVEPGLHVEGVCIGDEMF